MSYDFCITRMNPETNVDNSPISLEEWIHLVESDDELNFSEVNVINPITKQKIYIEKGTVVLWLNPDEDDYVEFHFSNGKVCVNGYDTCLINKVKALARKLNAYAYEDGELLV